MAEAIATALEVLGKDYQAVVGRPFEHFYCPILYRDEDVNLCRAHVVNRKCSGSVGKWTVQRRDVDSFFGSHFESDFVTLQERGKHDPVSTIVKQDLARKLNPKITVDGEVVEHFTPSGPIPEAFTEISIEGPTLPNPVRLGLKIHVNEMLTKQSSEWRVTLERDLRLPALVSVLKSAHLTLFRLMGYRYALSAGGHFLGKTVLGDFFQTYGTRHRRDVLAAARPHFMEFVNIIRPAQSVPEAFGGTVVDRRLFLCTSSTGPPWALGIFVRTGDLVHAALLPLFEDSECAARFLRFMHDPAERFEVRYAVLGEERWQVSKESTMVSWPRAAFE